MKLKINAKTFIESLLKQDDGSVQLDVGIISAYIVGILDNAGIEAEARYQDTDWSISIKGKKYYIALDIDGHQPENQLLSTIRNFVDELNSGNDYEAWYSYRKGDHYLNVTPKEPGTKEERMTGGVIYE